MKKQVEILKKLIGIHKAYYLRKQIKKSCITQKSMFMQQLSNKLRDTRAGEFVAL